MTTIFKCIDSKGAAKTFINVAEFELWAKGRWGISVEILESGFDKKPAGRADTRH